jgi:hypothetical protein
VEDGIANLCLLVRRSEFERCRKWQVLLEHVQSGSPYLARRLVNAVPLWEQPLALFAIPYGYVRRHADGPWRLGDQAAVIPSLAGEGMSIALHSARLAASVYLNGGNAETFQKRMYRDVSRQVAIATAISRAFMAEPARSLIEFGTRLWPGMLSAAAAATRIHQHACISDTILRD